jgi:regulator of chromosome condensation
MPNKRALSPVSLSESDYLPIASRLRQRAKTLEQPAKKKLKTEPKKEKAEAKKPLEETIVLIVGSGEMGELGLGEDIRECGKPGKVSPTLGIGGVGLDCGGGHTALVLQSGRLWTWGVNDEHNCARPLTKPTEDYEYEGECLPGEVQEFQMDNDVVVNADQVSIVQVACGSAHSIALDSNGRVFSWGTYKDWEGKAKFDKSGNVQMRPKLMNGALKGKKIVSVAAGEDFELAVDSLGNVYEWGAKLYEKDDANKGLFLEPRLVKYTKEKKAKGDSHYKVFAGVMARYLLAGNSVYAWGLNASGQCGFVPQSEDENVLYAPTLIESLSGKDIVKISAGQRHGIALTASGSVYVWGMNEYGQLGRGENTNDQKFEPHLLKLKEKVIDVAAGTNHSILVVEFARPLAFGSNASSNLGLGSDEDYEIWSPREIQGKSIGEYKVLRASASAQFSAFLCSTTK